ncbi:MAG: hypothetical protein HN848_04155 [Thiotrichales bacterium]|jgi:cytochrome oxidase Cu insertion factor (SCO1/SenC/PrrC family)|nr:hypothetical protein [Thiotrichales bacterium]MBT7314689.1 hypothetical protein [Thiotrichales bacterium]
MRFISLFLSLIYLAFFSLSVSAVEVAPRITDREIIETLAEIKGEFKVIDQRFDAVDKRFDSVDKRFDAIDQRFASLESTMLTLFSAIIILITGLIGFIIWDRRTALKPLERDMQDIKRTLERDFDMSHPDGNILSRLLDVMRELSKKDHDLAVAMRGSSLL